MVGMATPRRPQRRRQTSKRGVNLLAIGLAGFVVGVVLHVFVVYAVLGSGGGGNTSSPNDNNVVDIPAPTVVIPTPTATALPDRTSCEEIAGTQYRSTTERDWYRANCIN